jgi:hypothetical protein
LNLSKGTSPKFKWHGYLGTSKASTGNQAKLLGAGWIVYNNHISEHRPGFIKRFGAREYLDIGTRLRLPPFHRIIRALFSLTDVIHFCGNHSKEFLLHAI